MRTVLACVGLVVVLCRVGMAQCPTPSQLTDTYRAVLLRPFDDQLEPLLALRKQWEQYQQPFDSIYVGTLLQLGQGYHTLGDLNRAVGVVSRAVSVCRANPARTRVADLTKAWYRLGALRNFQNQIQASMSALKQAVRTGSADPQSANWVGSAYLYQAYNYTTLGDCQQTTLQADAGLFFAQQIKDKRLIANLLRQKAQALFILDNYAQAQSDILAAIDNISNEDTYQNDLADCYNLLSLILAGQGQYQEAIRYAERSYAIAEKTKYTELPNIANGLSVLYAKVSNYAKAIQYSQYGIDHAIDVFIKANSYSILGATYWRQQQFDRALTYYQQGLRTLPIGFRGQTVAANPDEEQLRLVAHKGIALTLIQDKADTWLDYAKATNNRQRLRYALGTYRVADQMIDYMRWEHTGQQSKLFWRKKTRSMYEHAIETCYLLGDTEQAFRFFEKSRAVMLADQLNELGARQQLSKTQSDAEKKLRDAVSDQHSNLVGLAPNDAGCAQAWTDLFAKQDSLDAFLRQLETTNPVYFRYKYDNRTPSLTDLQSHLKTRQSSFVTYFRGDSALYVLGVTGDTATLHRQPAGAHARTTQQFMALLANPDAMNRTTTVARFLTLGNELYRQLLAPLHIPRGRVIVSPDGSFVPFETLSRSATRPDYLVNQYAFSYAYSANLLLRHGAAPTQTAGFVTGDFLGVAPVSFAPALGQATLFGSDDALKLIAARFGSSTLLTHERATRRAFLTDVLAYRVIHLFTHATADTTDQEPTLYFADSTLRLSDLGDAGLPNAQLVVLAACQTGIGAIQRGEGVFSLARGFSALGAPSVLTTLWSVENKATYAITDLFYDYLGDGLPKDVALQRAKQDWLATVGGAGQLPNFWAGLILIGDTVPLDRPTRWPWVAGGILLVLGAGGGALWWRRRKGRVDPVIPRLYPA